MIPDRQVVDFHSSQYGPRARLLAFLINCNMCMVNGRNNSHNDFTYISTNGHSVVDYCLVPHESLPCFLDFCVHRVSSLSEDVDILTESPPLDHSLLSWTWELQSDGEPLSTRISTTAYGENNDTHKLFEIDDIPDNFKLGEKVVQQIDEMLAQLQQQEDHQECLDTIFINFRETLASEMNDKLESRIIRTGSNKRKKYKPQREYWSPELTRLWKDYKQAEDE